MWDSESAIDDISFSSHISIRRPRCSGSCLRTTRSPFHVQEPFNFRSAEFKGKLSVGCPEIKV